MTITAPRRNFPDKIKEQIVERSKNQRGDICCEKCGLVLGKKPYQIDHTVMEAMVTDKSKPLTAEDGQLLGQACCHAPKTVDDVGKLAKARRTGRKDNGIRKTSSFRKPPPGYGYDWSRGRYTRQP